MRHTASAVPLSAPWIWIASTPYCEQDGMNRHFGPNIGEIHF
jgi:hypothetical protein